MLRRGETLDQVCSYLRSHGFPDLSFPDLQDWLERWRKSHGAAEQDPLGGERDECRRSEKLDSKLLEAAERIPGAAELIGLGNLVNDIGEAEKLPDRREAMAWVARAILDFIVPELLHAKTRYVNTLVTIPAGGGWHVWDGGVRKVTCSTVAIHDASGNTIRVIVRARPRGSPYQTKPYNTTVLPLRRATLVMKADKDGVMQRVIQSAQEFRAARHGRIPQIEMADGFDRTKQAVSHQRLLLLDRVAERTGGRRGSRGIRNLRRKKR
jgi:hypothetical protein